MVYRDPAGTEADARSLLADSEAAVAIVTGTDPKVFVDGTELFVAQSALRRGGSLPLGVQSEILFNPQLSTAAVMVPSLIGLILLFIGTVITSLGVVREREQGTLEQLAVTPLRPVLRGRESGEERGVRRYRPWRDCLHALMDLQLTRQGLEKRRRLAIVPVDGHAIGAQRIDDDQHQVARRSRSRWPLTAGPRQQQDAEETGCGRAGGEHRHFHTRRHAARKSSQLP